MKRVGADVYWALKIHLIPFSCWFSHQFQCIPPETKKNCVTKHKSRGKLTAKKRDLIWVGALSGWRLKPEAVRTGRRTKELWQRPTLIGLRFHFWSLCPIYWSIALTWFSPRHSQKWLQSLELGKLPGPGHLEEYFVRSGWHLVEKGKRTICLNSWRMSSSVRPCRI